MKILENPLVPVLTPDSPFPTFTSKVFPFHSQFSPFHSQFSLSFLTFPLLFPIFPLPFPVFRFLSHFPDFPVPISRSEPHKRRRNPGINERKTGICFPPSNWDTETLSGMGIPASGKGGKTSGIAEAAPGCVTLPGRYSKNLALIP